MAEGMVPSVKDATAGSASNKALKGVAAMRGAGEGAFERKALLYGGVALVAVAAVAAVVLGGVHRSAGADAVAGSFREAGLLPLAWLVAQWPLPALAIALPPAFAGAASLACALRPAWWRAARLCGRAVALYAAVACVGVSLPAMFAIPNGVPVGRKGRLPGAAVILCGLAFAFPLALPPLFVAYGAGRVGSGFGERTVECAGMVPAAADRPAETDGASIGNPNGK